MNRNWLSAIMILLITGLCTSVQAQRDQSNVPTLRRDAEPATIEANQKIGDELGIDDNVTDEEDYRLATRGLIDSYEVPVIPVGETNPDEIVYNLEEFSFLEPDPEMDTPAPDTTNPSLWRQSQLLSIHGLFKVTDPDDEQVRGQFEKGDVYQARGYDLANISFVRSENGWVMIDPLSSTETVAACVALFREHVDPGFNVSAVIFTHSHLDHYAGVRELEKSGFDPATDPLIAPEGFLEEAVSENVMAGNVMSRRASYMYGIILPAGPKGTLGSGLGVTTSTGTATLIVPNVTVTNDSWFIHEDFADDIVGTVEGEDAHHMDVDGLKIDFMNTPGAEAPAEMMFYFPERSILCVAEDVNATMHNILTLRGAKVRDPLRWSKYVNQAIRRWGNDTSLAFGSHHWPRWNEEGTEENEAIEYMKKQRDMYRYLHDQTLRLTNQGYKGTEIAEMIRLPESLSSEFYNRGYYGTVNHNVKAVYQRYMGWFDGNPAHLNELPETESSTRYVTLMGGETRVIDEAKKSFDDGEYRWAAQLLNHVVFKNPRNERARLLQARTLEQLGYQAESGPWRNFYLTGAQELRIGKPRREPDTESASPDTVRAMPLELFFDYLALRLNGPLAEGRTLGINFVIVEAMVTPIKPVIQYDVMLENSVLFTTEIGEGASLAAEECKITLTRDTFDKVVLGDIKLPEAIEEDLIGITGSNPGAFEELLVLLDDFEFWFNIVTPNPPPAMPR